jgi:hypothetical protein
MLRRLLRDRLILVLAVSAGLWMYGSAMIGLTDLDRRLAFAWSEQQRSRPAAEAPPAIHGTPVRFNARDCPARERPLHRTDRTL